MLHWISPGCTCAAKYDNAPDVSSYGILLALHMLLLLGRHDSFTYKYSLSIPANLLLEFPYVCSIPAQNLLIHQNHFSVLFQQPGLNCSTGWLTHWGQAMTNNSAQQMVDSFTRILQYGNNTGSVNLYMAHGGTNFGFYAGE